MVPFIRSRRLAVSVVLTILLAATGVFGLAGCNNAGNAGDVSTSPGFILAKPVFPHSVVDQSYIRTADAATNEHACTIVYCQPLGQEFTPSAPVLGGVDVELWTANSGHGDNTITVNIRKGTIENPVLATASQIVPKSTGAAPHGGLTHFDFPSPLAVTLDEKYGLEVQATKPTHQWRGPTSGVLYPGGQAILQGRLAEDSDLVEDADLFFQTYSAGAPGITEPTAPAASQDCPWEPIPPGAVPGGPSGCPWWRGVPGGSSNEAPGFGKLPVGQCYDTHLGVVYSCPDVDTPLLSRRRSCLVLSRPSC
jgi:hypothetical protein